MLTTVFFMTTPINYLISKQKHNPNKNNSSTSEGEKIQFNTSKLL